MIDMNFIFAVFGGAGLTVLLLEIQDRKNEIIEKIQKFVEED